MQEPTVPIELTAVLLQVDIPQDIQVPLPVSIVRRLSVLNLTDSEPLKDLMFRELRRLMPLLSRDVGFCVYTYLFYLAGGYIIEQV